MHAADSLEAQSSQESNWTAYTNGGSLSAQSSQEELPEAMIAPEGSRELSNSHYFMHLTTLIDRQKPQQYRYDIEHPWFVECMDSH